MRKSKVLSPVDKSRTNMRGYKLAPGESSRRSAFSMIKKTARNKHLYFEITFDEFIALSEQRCHYCNAAPTTMASLSRKNLNGTWARNGLDRIDNTKGYTIDNVVPCCAPCNYMKGKHSVLFFLKHIRKIGNYQRFLEIFLSI